MNRLTREFPTDAEPRGLQVAMLPSEPEIPVMVELSGDGILPGDEIAVGIISFATRRMILFGRKSGTITLAGDAP
ncbi:hypothetical protein GCM10027052_09630 [Parafrigoribacterium mesophilum]